MRTKVLITGKNNTVIDDIFVQLTDSMELMTSSLRWDDLMAHVKYFQPDAFCYCISNEPRESIDRVTFLKRKLGDGSIPFFVIGSHENCADFVGLAPHTADVLLTSPMKALDIGSRINKYIKEHGGIKTRIPEEEYSIESLTPAKEELEELLRKRILVIDDNRTMLKTINESLRNKYEVATAVSGRVGLKFLEKKMVDLILLDYEMPDENGPQVLEKLRANNITKNIPVIFLTGVTERSKIAQALAFQPQGYLLKPIERDKLLSAIEDILGV